ncbi:PIN domain-like protein [Microthyrium microscopicum]|uniref:PIN domain-like protein n=1 Tax=Microthyrium microscopicum TaxID=703497 RepID=A0A6A6UGU3_9PEZI|nr:PIN domain-like protein [Microthyrium microscopicum]
MGITGIWPYLGDGEVVPIVQLASEHFQRYGRPFRIAIDEAQWRFNNLNDGQVANIRKSSDAAQFSNPIEKAIFYRVTGLLRQNIELIFVFDGPKRPWKKGRNSGNKVNYERIEMTKNIFKNLRVPFHLAPGEAEAECARLQQAGIVDAVWSDDSDALMFGCDFLIRTHYAMGANGKAKEGPKSKTHMRVYRSEALRKLPKLANMDKHGMVLFALLNGGDYDAAGLRGCGPETAIRAVGMGFGQSLANFDPKSPGYGLVEWRLQLSSKFGLHVPMDFPPQRAWNYYCNPTVTQDLSMFDTLWDPRSIEESVCIFSICFKCFTLHVSRSFACQRLLNRMFLSILVCRQCIELAVSDA